MAWALKFDGVNDYCTFTPTQLHSETGRTSYEYELELITDSASSQIRLLGNDNSVGYLFINATDVIVRYGTSSSTQVVIPCVVPFDDTQHNIKIRRDGNNHTVLLDGVLVGTTVDSQPSSGITLSRIGKIGSTVTPALSLVSLVFRESIGGADIVNWNATVSNHSAGTPILVDTVGSNNATGVNMPTDGSAWLDLGGGGTTGTITQTAQSFTQSLSASLGFSGLINQTAQSFTQSLDGTALLNITGGINQTLNTFTQSATGTSLLNVTGAANQTVSTFTQSATGILIAPIDGAIIQTVSSFTMSATGRTPIQWVDKIPVSTSWSEQAPTTTTWTEQAGVLTIWTDKV